MTRFPFTTFHCPSLNFTSCPCSSNCLTEIKFFFKAETILTSFKVQKFLLSMESVCSQDVPGFDSVRLQWEPVGTEDELGADLAVTDVLELWRASTGLSVVNERAAATGELRKLLDVQAIVADGS
ncbi:unnamed protein product [Cuscuta campestris]|uniref:Uncharacterized protein n=1 Tax=Cuscuta campestris TaxID=132261 RepID=A0A484NHI3_9ASTE|nr:unnamed protein product [Cuscuta campestris]